MPSLNSFVLIGMGIGAASTLLLALGRWRSSYAFGYRLGAALVTLMFVGAILGFAIGKVLGAKYFPG
jgi:hypothetical protein